MQGKPRLRPSDQFNPAGQIPCTFFQTTRFRLWTAVQQHWLPTTQIALHPALHWPGSREFGRRVKTLATPELMVPNIFEN